MNTSHNPLVDSVTLDDTLLNVRQVLAVLAAAASADESVVWTNVGAGSQFLLQQIDDALAEVEKIRQPWARSAPAPGGEG